MLSAQEIFDRVATHLLTQKKQARTETGECRYLTSDGLKCAIGCLIPDGHPGQRSNAGAPGLFGGYPDLAELVGWGCGHGDRARFLCDLQWIHDRQDPSTWWGNLRSLAIEHDLRPNVLDGLI